MDLSDIEARVREVLKRVARFEGGYSSSADLYGELGVKSIAALDLLLSLEEEFGVSIADDAFSNARTLDDLVALVKGPA
jgi:acyl carrier protein